MYIVKFIQTEDAPLSEGIFYVAIFGVALILGSFMRGYYVFNGYMMGIRGRKVMVTAMFNKVAKLSMQSLARTNSGKLVTLISADLLNLERSMTMTPVFFSAIALNVTCYIVIGIMFKSWVYVLIIAGIWLMMITSQIYTARFLKYFVMEQSGRND